MCGKSPPSPCVCAKRSAARLVKAVVSPSDGRHRLTRPQHGGKLIEQAGLEAAGHLGGSPSSQGDSSWIRVAVRPLRGPGRELDRSRSVQDPPLIFLGHQPKAQSDDRRVSKVVTLTMQNAAPLGPDTATGLHERRRMIPMHLAEAPLCEGDQLSDSIACSGRRSLHRTHSGEGVRNAGSQQTLHL